MRFFKLLPLGLLCMLLAACVPAATAPAPESSAPIASSPSASSPSTPEPPDASPSPSPAAPPEVCSAYASEVDLGSFDRVHQLSAEVGDAYPGEFDVVVWCEEPMLEFTVFTVSYDGERFYEVEALYTAARIAPGEAAAFAAWLPESIPATKLSFLTESGLRVERLLAWSGRDGSVYLLEL